MRIDYCTQYHAHEAIARAENLVKKNQRTRMWDIVEDLLKLQIRRGNYTVGKTEEGALFGKVSCETERRHPLLLVHDSLGPVAGVGRSFSSDTVIQLSFAQYTNHVDPDTHKFLRSDLGINPLDFLVGHFIARLRPLLDRRPDADVNLWVTCEKYKSRFFQLRDRFFTPRPERPGVYPLNPARGRVEQLLGERNAWILAR